MMAGQNGAVRKGIDEEIFKMLYFRACPKCQTGTIEHNRDPYTEYLQCLNCGLMRDVPDDTDAAAALKQLHVEFKAAKAAEVGDESESGATPAARKFRAIA